MSDEATAPIVIPDHPLIPPGEPELITTTAGLRELMEHVRSVGICAYDTEFIGELSYFPQICLVQIATPERIAVVDPLEDVDLTSLWESIADPAVETIVHAGVQDLEPVTRHIGRPPATIIDTQIAAGFVGQPYPCSLRKLVLSLAGVRLGKAMTFTQWDHRPLSRRHLHYAADDVRYLPAVRAAIGEKLEALGHAAWVLEECGPLMDEASYRFDSAHQALRFKGATRLNEITFKTLRSLVELRDELAREQNVPPRTFLRDDAVMRLARDKPKQIGLLADLRGVPRPVAERYGARIIETIEAAPEREAIARPSAKYEEETAEDRVRVEGMMLAVSSFALGQGVDPSLVLVRADVQELYHRYDHGKPIEDARIMRGWRGELLGSALAGFFAGTADLTFHWNAEGLRVRPSTPS
jgi:ribonuclease D